MFAGFEKLRDKFANVSTGLRDAALAAVYPSQCRVCGGIVESWSDGAACDYCWREIEMRSAGWHLCIKCGIPFAAGDARRSEIDRPVVWTCGKCDDFAFEFARACGEYRGALRASILELKLRPHFPRRLRDLMKEGFAGLPERDRIESIVPVPLHRERLKERGFNQAEIIARRLASIAGLRVDSSAVVRVKKTERHRAGMAARERALSLDMAFNVRAPRLVEDRRLLVVDDVMTTGSTAQELSRTLIESGARSVDILTLARARNELVQ
jgi:ComF family protein